MGSAIMKPFTKRKGKNRSNVKQSATCTDEQREDQAIGDGNGDALKIKTSFDPPVISMNSTLEAETGDKNIKNKTDALSLNSEEEPRPIKPACKEKDQSSEEKPNVFPIHDKLPQITPSDTSQSGPKLDFSVPEVTFKKLSPIPPVGQSAAANKSISPTHAQLPFNQTVPKTSVINTAYGPVPPQGNRPKSVSTRSSNSRVHRIKPVHPYYEGDDVMESNTQCAEKGSNDQHSVKSDSLSSVEDIDDLDVSQDARTSSPKFDDLEDVKVINPSEVGGEGHQDSDVVFMTETNLIGGGDIVVPIGKSEQPAPEREDEQVLEMDRVIFIQPSPSGDKPKMSFLNGKAECLQTKQCTDDSYETTETVSFQSNECNSDPLHVEAAVDDCTRTNPKSQNLKESLSIVEEDNTFRSTNSDVDIKDDIPGPSCSNQFSNMPDAIPADPSHAGEAFINSPKSSDSNKDFSHNMSEGDTKTEPFCGESIVQTIEVGEMEDANHLRELPKGQGRCDLTMLDCTHESSPPKSVVHIGGHVSGPQPLAAITGRSPNNSGSEKKLPPIEHPLPLTGELLTFSMPVLGGISPKTSAQASGSAPNQSESKEIEASNALMTRSSESVNRSSRPSSSRQGVLDGHSASLGVGKLDSGAGDSKETSAGSEGLLGGSGVQQGNGDPATLTAATTNWTSNATDTALIAPDHGGSGEPNKAYHQCDDANGSHEAERCRPVTELVDPELVENIQRQLFEEGLKPTMRDGGVSFFVPMTEDGLQPTTPPIDVADRITKGKKPSLSYEEKMMLANLNRQEHLSKLKEFAVRDLQNVRQNQSVSSSVAATGAEGAEPPKESDKREPIPEETDEF